MSVSKLCLRFLSVLSILLVVTLTASAQYRAGIHGTVLDAQGGAVPDAKVTVTAKETGLAQETTSDSDGVYSVNRLAPGLYSVTVEKAGFKKKVLDNVQIIPEQVNALNITLEVGQVSESVVVSGDQIPAIDTESGTVAGTVTSDQIQQLPSFGRDVFQLIQLAPGVFGDASRDQGGGTLALPNNQGPGGTGNSSGPFQTENRAQVSINGGRNDQNNVTLDGVGITSVSWGGAAIITPNEDTVKEVRVVSSDYDAENGRFGSGQIQVLSQSGTNQYHGSFFYKWAQPAFNAYQHYNGTWNAPATPQKNTAKFNDWGLTAGGPVLKNKLFLFFGYETISNNGSQVSQGWYPTPALLSSAPAGSLAARYAAFPGELPVYSSVLDFTCASVGLVEGSNCHEIPGQGLDVGRPLDPSAFPLGTADPSFVSNLNPGLGGDGTGSASNLDGVADMAYAGQVVGPTSNTNKQYYGRVDFNLTSKDLLAFNIYYTPVSNRGFNGAQAYPANVFFHEATNEAMTFLWNHTFAPTLINEARVNAAGWRWNELASNPQTPLGLPTTTYIGDPDNGNNIGTVCPGCNGPGGNAGSIFDQWTYGYKDVVTKVQGSHTLKFGGEVTELHFVQEAPWSARPTFGFKNFWDFLNDAADSENGTFDPLTGIPTDVRKDSRQTMYSLFFQDNWKLKPNFTLTLGIRWENPGTVTFTRNQLSSIVLGQGTDVLTGMAMRVGGDLYNTAHNNWGPQVGFAWSPRALGSHEFNSKLVLRGGFGIGYTPVQQAITLNGWSNIPFTDNGTRLTGSNILYDFPTDPKQFSPYPANPATISTFDSNNIPTSGSPVEVQGTPFIFPTPYTMRYSMQAQYDLGSNWVATLGYQGSSSRHLTRQYNLNLIYGAQGIPLNPFVNDVRYFVNDGNANYNAMLLEIEHRFSQSFQIDGSYRYAKGLDNGSNPYWVNPYQWDAHADWGPSDFDVTNTFKVWGIYTPNFFHEGWKKSLLGGWSISGIFNWHSGFPWTPLVSVGCDVIYQNGGCLDGGGSGYFMPVAYAGGGMKGTSNSDFLNAGRAGGNFSQGGSAYFTLPSVTPCSVPFPQTCPGLPPAPGIGRNSFRGSRYLDLDATIVKSFALPKMKFIGENAALELRANAYNLFNNLNLSTGNPGCPTCSPGIDPIITDPTFGQPRQALGGRTMELQARFSF